MRSRPMNSMVYGEECRGSSVRLNDVVAKRRSHQTMSLSEPVDNVLSLLNGVRATGNNQWMARCPCRNDDSNPSLAVAQGDDGTALLHCHRGNGCSLDDICKSIGLTSRDLFTDDDDWKPVERPKSTSKIDKSTSVDKKKMGKKVEKVYPYTDEDGVLLYEKVRFRMDDGSKSFANRQPDAARPGEYIWNLKSPPVRRVLYRLPEVIRAIKDDEPVWLVEGEKDVDTLCALGIYATTMDSGAGKWEQSYTDVLSAAHVEIIADNDDVGRLHAIQVSERLLAAGARGCTIWVSRYGKDISDHIAAGKGFEELTELRLYDLPDSAPELESVDDGASEEEQILEQIADVFGREKLTLEQKLTRALLLINSISAGEARNTGRTVKWQDFLNEAEQDTYDWVIPGMLERRERVIVVAAEGVGKTMLARQVALCTAAGIHPFTLQPMKPVRTLTIDLENPETIIRRTSRNIMMNAMKMARASDVDAHLHLKPDGIDLCDAKDRAYIEELIDRIKPEIVFMGPLYKSYVDNGTRTSEAMAVEVAKFLDMIRDVHGCALWLEHHAPLGTSMASRDLRPFGSSVWSRWPEFGISLTPDPTALSGYEYNVNHFRGARDKRPWPTRMARGIEMPFVVLEFMKVD